MEPEVITIGHPLGEPGWPQSRYYWPAPDLHCESLGIVAYHDGGEPDAIVIATPSGERRARVIGARYRHGTLELDIVGPSHDDMIESAKLSLKDEVPF